MFTEVELDFNKFEDNYDNDFTDAIERSLNVLCSDSMTILQNNSKVLRFLTDKDLSKELEMIAQSLTMAIKHGRFELIQNIIGSLKDQVHKLAALEIKYFDDNQTLLRTDIYNTFMPQNFKKHAFITPCLKEVIEILNSTTKLSPTNAAFALNTAIEAGEYDFVERILFNGGLTEEFIRQVYKRYHANFGMPLEEDIENSDIRKCKKLAIKELFQRAI